MHANYDNLRVKFYTQIFLICMYFLVYFCVYFFTRVFHAFFLVEIACNMADLFDV